MAAVRASRGKIGWLVAAVLALAAMPTSIARGDELAQGLRVPTAAAALATESDYLFSEWSRGPNEHSNVVVVDALLAERLEHLGEVSPAFRRAWAELEASGIPVLVGSSEQLDPVTPSHLRESRDWAGVTMLWSEEAEGSLHRAAVSIRIQWLRDLHDHYGNPNRAFLEALDDLLIREVYGVLVPMANG